jgi:hypothetical protein
MTVALSLSPEPGGGTFTVVNGTYGLDAPMPRYAIAQPQGGSFASIAACPLDSTGDQPVSFSYALNGPNPNPVNESVASGVSIHVMASTTGGGSWLSASIASGVLTISASPDPTMVFPPVTYKGTVQLSASGKQTVVIPVTLQVYPAPLLVVTKSHPGNAVDGGQLQYSIQVTNIRTTGGVNVPFTVTDVPSSGLSIASMSGTGWDCSNAPSCSAYPALSIGQSTNPLYVTVNVAANATSPQVNAATLSVTGFLDATVYDTTIVTGTTCTVTQDQIVSVSDVQYIISEMLGLNPPYHDLNFDGTVNAADVQIVINALINGICIV